MVRIMCLMAQRVVLSTRSDHLHLLYEAISPEWSNGIGTTGLHGRRCAFAQGALNINGSDEPITALRAAVSGAGSPD